MASEGRGILSPVRLPVPPLQQVFGSLDFTACPRHSHRDPSRRNPPATASRAARSRLHCSACASRRSQALHLSAALAIF